MGAAERLNRSFEEGVMCMLQETERMLDKAKLPKSFWWEALLAWVYVYNRMPTSTVKDKTSFETFYKIKLSIGMIRSFW
jgi:hypothetical protein